MSSTGLSLRTTPPDALAALAFSTLSQNHFKEPQMKETISRIGSIAGACVRLRYLTSNLIGNSSVF